MKLKKIKIENLRSHENTELVFPEGSFLLSGDIGSGKTSLLLAIEYALFGFQTGQRGSSLLSNSKDFGSVSLEIEIDGKQILIERRMKRSSKTVNQDSASITVDGLKEDLSVTELKSKVIDLLNYPQEFLKKTNTLYRYTVYSPQEEMKQIILEDAETRLDTLRHIFGVDKYRKIKENLQLVTGKLREKARMFNVELRDYLSLIENIESQKRFLENTEKIIEKKVSILKEIRDLKKIQDEEIKNFETKAREKQIFDKEVEKANIMLSNKMDQIDREMSELKKLEKSLSEDMNFNQEEHLKTLTNIKETKLKIELLNKEILEKTSIRKSHLIKVKENLDKKNRLSSLDFCPTCLQNVNTNHKHNISADVEKTISESNLIIEKSDKEVLELNFSLQKEKNALENLEKERTKQEILKAREAEKSKKQEKIIEIKKNKEFLEKDVEFLVNHINTLKKSILQHSVFENQFKTKKEQLQLTEKKERDIEIEIAQSKKEKEMTGKTILSLQQELSKKEKIKNELQKTTELEKWLSGDFTNLISFTEKNIMLRLREDFSKLFNRWFLILTSESFSARLDENFTPIIIQNGFETDYAFLSGGERTAVALAYRLALNQVVNSLFSRIRTKDIIILDEPTDGFSEQQLDKMKDILTELQTKQLILVSHEPKMESFVDHVIKVAKNNGLSTLTTS